MPMDGKLTARPDREHQEWINRGAPWDTASKPRHDAADRDFAARLAQSR